MKFDSLRTSVTVSAWVLAIGGVGAGVYFGIMAAVHAEQTKSLHQAHNLSYTLRDCTTDPGGAGTEWSATVTLHNTNPDRIDGYGVQVQFLGPDGAPLAWTSVRGFGGMSSGATKTATVTATSSASGTPQVTCKPVFYRGDKPAGTLAPLPAK